MAHSPTRVRPAQVGPTTLEKLRRLPWSFAADAGNTAFIQLTFFGSIFVLFLSELGLSKGSMGVLLSLLPFAGAAVPLVAGRIAAFGYKRTYLIFFGARTLTAGLLLLTPWVIGRFGPEVGLLYVGSIVGLFALLRAVGMAAMGPWSHEYIPSQIRGRYSAMGSALQGVVGFVVILGATYVLDRLEGLSGFMLLIAVGVLFGAGAVVAGFFIPGGAPETPDPAGAGVRAEMALALRDRDYRTFLISFGLVLFGFMPLFSFLPLFMREQVGLPDNQVVLLQSATLLGGLITSYVWGWAADRYGSKPVMITGLILRLLLPVGWLLMPRFSPWSLPVALVIAGVQGIGTFGWVTGSTRLHYVNLIPAAHKRGYIALFMAWTGIVDGASQLAGGWILQRSDGLGGEGGLVDPYLPLFVLGLALPLVGLYLLQSVQTDDSLNSQQFMRMFVRGRPLLALRSLVGFYRAKDDLTASRMTARLGRAKSPFAEEELCAALNDPRFHVRFEAIIAIAHSRPTPKLTEALVQVLQGSDPVLTVVAAWALGRVGDARAVGPLRAGLFATHQSVKGYSARSLGILQDRSVVPLLLARLPVETDLSLQVAYASALGQLRVPEAAPLILDLLRRTHDPMVGKELALALARILGGEHQFLTLMRQAESDSCTATAQALLAARKSLGALANEAESLYNAMEQCAETLAGDDLANGIDQLCAIVHLLPHDKLDEARRVVLVECADRLSARGAQGEAESPLYLLLALHALHLSPRTPDAVG